MSAKHELIKTHQPLTGTTTLLAPGSSELSSHHSDIGSCSDTKNIDAMMVKYLVTRNKLLEKLNTDPEGLSKEWFTPKSEFFSNDDACMCKMGEGEKYSYYTCSQCVNIGRIMNFKVDKINKPFVVQTGSLLGKSLIVNSYPLVSGKPKMTLDLKGVERATKIHLKNPELVLSKTIQYYKFDPFSNSVIHSWILEIFLQPFGFNSYVKQYTAFVCRNVGHTLTEYPTIGSFNNIGDHSEFILSDEKAVPKDIVIQKDTSISRDTAVIVKKDYGTMLEVKDTSFKRLKPDIAFSIIAQLAVTLLHLEQIQFVHGNPCVSSLVFDKSSHGYNHGELKIYGELTLKLTNLELSSSTVSMGKTRLIPDFHIGESVMDYSIPVISSKSIVEKSPIGTTGLSKLKEVKTFRILPDISGSYLTVRTLGLPLCSGSFDFYSFIISLMTEPMFYETVSRDPKLYSIFEKMWVNEEQLRKISYKIKTFALMRNTGTKKEPFTAKEIASLLMGIDLRCDVNSYILDIMKG